jgi:hypothetical protein
MRPPLVATLGALVLVFPMPGAAVTLEDCERWRQQLKGEASQVEVSGAAGRNERDSLVEDVDAARTPGDAKSTADALRGVDEFRKRAGRLTAEGKVSATAGKRLDTLADTYRHCIEQAR